MIQSNPMHPIPTKVILQPNARYKYAINGAATTEPNEAPAPKIPCAIARSFDGNHSALLLVAPGQLPASLKPSMALNMLNEKMDLAKACNAIDTLQALIEITIPILVPMASIILPVTIWPIA